MGCFSFLCKECNEPINSDSVHGEWVRLFLLNKGKVVHEMEGEYDSYGRVFIDGTQDNTVDFDLRESATWDCAAVQELINQESNPLRIEYYKDDPEGAAWNAVCRLMDKAEGIKEFPTISQMEKMSHEELMQILREEKTSWIEEPDPSCGIAAVHSNCFKTIPTTCSERDPDQGWGSIKKKHRKKN